MRLLILVATFKQTHTVHRYMVHRTWYMVYGTWYIVYGTWYMVYGTW